MNPIQQAVSTAHQQGLSNVDIAAQTGYSLSTVRRACKALGLTGNGNRYVPAEEATTYIAQEARRRGLTVQTPAPGQRCDLVIEGVPVDVKASTGTDRATRKADVTSEHHMFFLSQHRRPYRPPFDYRAYHRRDAEVVAFACLDDRSRVIETYFLDADKLNASVSIGGRNTHMHGLENWARFAG